MNSLKVRMGFILIALSLTGCAVTNGPPKIGMKYQDIYPNGLVHAGLDLDVPYDSPVRAIGDGEIGGVSRNPKEMWLTILHGDGNSSFYYHLGKVVVKERELVKKGQVVAYTGATGYSSPNRNQMITYPHLHLEINIKGNRANPELLNMTCPSPTSKWWWPVGCEEFYKDKKEK